MAMSANMGPNGNTGGNENAGLVVRGLTTTFDTPRGLAIAAADVDFDVAPGEIVGLVGESGSGKSVTLRSIMGLIRKPGRTTGHVDWRGRDLVAMSAEELRRIRGSEIAMIFQEPMTALNPVLPVGMQIEENLIAHTTLTARQRRSRALELMNIVGIPAAERRLDEYPHQFSGGMRQRVMIAIALACSPKLLLADEPTTALDVTIQDQILKLLLDLRDRMAMSVVLVTHDLGVVAATCDRMAVMYAGRIVETGTVAEVFARPRHSYTRGLLGSVPRSGTSRTMLQSIEGTPPSLTNLPTGCAFHPRCSFATDMCLKERPVLEAVTSPTRTVACFHHERVAAAEAIL
ncbi:ABC transporter ATP-binding protein [Neorhizobium sp. Rsf11]|uniref:ABC transporter ATP-binding protein n=2 Tax=Neorhizobium TaxID=1525371 RepID=A0ABV0LZB6_9HYPH|nr:ABC transporter ATP-binding protein [Neorhizobium petrolearium]MCC2610905.1 ABC transporter ATP-binding protein [Neorhizobium petrolearium]WGI71019.1 ABC transporter ATP-binding protein [Neorhizobium petrolearium]